MKVLCAVDFTRRSDEAVIAAHAIAQHCGASLALVHLPEPATNFFNTEDDATLRQSLLKAASARLEERVRRFAGDAPEPTWEVRPLREGQSITEALASYATTAGVDLVVVSTHGKSGSKMWPMGSLAADIIETLPMPVLVVNTAGPFLKWQKATGTLRVFAGLDLSEESGQVLKALPQFHFDRNSHIVAGYAQQVQPVVPDPLLSSSVSTLPYAGDEAGLEKRLRTLVAQYLPACAAEVKVRTGFSSPAHNLIEMATSNEADLVVVGTHQRHAIARFLLGSVSRGVLRETTASVLCIPLHQKPDAAAVGPRPSCPTAAAIFCATDFSNRSSQAALTAQELALRLGTSFTVAHIMEDQLAWPNVPDNTLPTLEDGFQTRLERFCLPLDHRGPRPVHTMIEADPHESIAQSLLKHLESTKPLLAVISTHGKSNAAWWPVGSTALKIAQESQVPVLIVQSAAPFLNWRSTGHKLCVLGAVDARGHSPGVLQWMKKLDTAGPCAFTLVHIDQTHGHVPSPATQNDSAPEPHSTILEHGFQSMARGILGDKADLTTIVKETWESVANELLEISRHAHADLIITGADQWHGIERWLHESVSRSLIKRSGTSLLCLPTSS